MSEPILMALVQLFAIVAASVKQQVSDNTRNILESYLRQHLNNQELEEYLKLFDELMFFHQPDENEIQDADVSKKIELICLKIQKQLTSLDRLIVFVKFLEFLDELTGDEGGKAAVESKLADKYSLVFKKIFNPPDQEFRDQRAFITNPFSGDIRSERLLIINSGPTPAAGLYKHIQRERLDGQILILYVPSVRTMICRYTGKDEYCD